MALRISPTSLNLMQKCERCFWLYVVKGVKRPEGVVSSLPNGMDRLLKKHFDVYRARGELPPELREQCPGYKLFADLNLLDVWRNNLKGLTYQDESGVVLTGAVDEILVKPGKLVVLDFKTRGFPRKEETHLFYQGNMDLYNFLLRENGFNTEDYSYLLFYHPTHIEEDGEIVFHADLVKMETDVGRAGQLVKKAVGLVLSGEMPEENSECEFCLFRRQAL